MAKSEGHDGEVNGCDHDRKEAKKANARSAGRRHVVPIPKEAVVMRRMSWAARSLGTVEYTGDLWAKKALALSGWLGSRIAESRRLHCQPNPIQCYQ